MSEIPNGKIAAWASVGSLSATALIGVLLTYIVTVRMPAQEAANRKEVHDLIDQFQDELKAERTYREMQANQIRDAIAKLTAGK